MIILGLNAFHADASAAIVRDGVLIAAAEEERFLRIKHWAGFPSEAIRYCLREAGLQLSDIDHIAINQNNKAHILRKVGYLLTHLPTVELIRERLRMRAERVSVPELLARAFPGQSFRGTLHHIEHHYAHLSSAFHVSPFDEAAVISVDGFGDFSSTAWGAGSGTSLSVDGRVYFPDSLGVFYLALTQYLGFPHYGDEYKVMGLAPYGEPTFLNDMRKIVRLERDGSFKLDLTYFVHQKTLPYNWRDGTPHLFDHFTPALEDLLGPRRKPDEPMEARHRNIARSVQGMYEEAFFHLVENTERKYGLNNLSLAGGCAMNSVANGKIRRRTRFKNVYVQSAAGDAGGAIGSAFGVWHQLGGKRSFVMEHAYWGPSFGSEVISKLLLEHKAEIADAGCTVEEISDESELCRRTSAAISEGAVVGWFQGRMEWGPRALGNRSILCDPRRPDMKSILNSKIKRRESFRPFAPSVLEEAVRDWFEEDDAVPFMMQVFQIREEKRPEIPAVTHVDGSGRLQTVSKQTNPLYHRLISAFAESTGVPMVLNTSFNENEPVVCTPGEALDCFLRTQMSVLVLGDRFISRPSGNA